MDFKSTRGSISIFALIVTSVIALGVGSLMISNFSIYQLSKSYHILRERLLIKKMLFQMTEEVVLSKYELSLFQSNESLEGRLLKEIDSAPIKFDECKVVENSFKEPNFESPISESTDRSLNAKLSSYLTKGPYVDRGEALFAYSTHGCSYSVKVHGYGVPISNFNFVLYDLVASENGQGKPALKNQEFYVLDKKGRANMINSDQSTISYKRRKDVSLFCNAYEWLWHSDYLQKLAKDSANSFILELPYNDDLEDPGIALKNENEITLDLEKIDFAVITISNPLGGGSIKIEDSIHKEKPLVIISYNNLETGSKTVLEIDRSLKRPLIVFALNTEIRFQNNPQIKGAFFLSHNSKATGRVFLDGHFSCYSGADWLDELHLNFARTDEIKLKLADKVPHVFVTELSLYE